MQEAEPSLLFYIFSIIFGIAIYALIGIAIYKGIKKIKKRNEAQRRLRERIKRMSNEERRAYYQEEANKAIIRMERYQRTREWERGWRR